jgi:MFS family permease
VRQTKKIEKARSVLQRVLPADEVDPKVTEIQRTLEKPVAYKVRDLKGKMLGLMPIVWVGILLSVFQQFVGINVIFYYSTSLWDAVGFGASASFWISVVTSIVNILVTIVAIATVDRFGRKPLLLVGSAGMTVSLALVTVCFWTAASGEVGTDNKLALGPVAGPLALVGANLFVVFFGMSWGPVVWVLLGEMFNNRIRAIALAVAAAAQWLANFVVTASFPTLKGINVALPYLLFTIFAILSFFFVVKFRTSGTCWHLLALAASSRYAASARVSSSGPRISPGSGAPDDMLVIRWRHRSRRSAARASRKLGVALRVYQGRTRQVGPLQPAR